MAGKVKLTEAQRVRKLNIEIFTVSEMLQGDAWISDEAGVETLTDFFTMIEAHLIANREASKAITAFLRKYKTLRRSAGRAHLASDSQVKEG